MQKEMERWFGNFTSRWGAGTRPLHRSGVYPLVNVYDDGESFIVRAELAGVDARDLDISVTGDTLTLQGERKVKEAPEGCCYHRRELSTGTFRRALTLPEQVDNTKVNASYTNGILEILLPRAEQARKHRIEVKSS
jgi:HSP20 family protein